MNAEHLLHSVLPLDVIDLSDTFLVVVGNVAGKKRLDDIFQFSERVLPAAERENVCTIVLAGILRKSHRIAGRSTDVRNLVGGHGCSDPGSVNDYSDVNLAAETAFATACAKSG